MLFLTVSVIIINAIAYLIPKNLTKQEIYVTSLFALFFEVMINIFLDIKFNLYGYFDVGVDTLTLIPVFGLYPAASVLFLNFYPYSKSNYLRIYYIAGCSLATLAFEWASIQTGYFYYNTWNLGFSAICYPLIYYILARHLVFFRWLKS